MHSPSLRRGCALCVARQQGRCSRAEGVPEVAVVRSRVHEGPAGPRVQDGHTRSEGGHQALHPRQQAALLLPLSAGRTTAVRAVRLARHPRRGRTARHRHHVQHTVGHTGCTVRWEESRAEEQRAAKEEREASDRAAQAAREEAATVSLTVERDRLVRLYGMCV